MIRYLGSILMTVLAFGCSDEPEILPNPLDPNVDPISEGIWYRPVPETTWQWQLTGELNTSYGVQVYDIDLFETDETIVQELQSRGIKVIAYFSGGSYEEWREDASNFNENVLGKNLDGWPAERWLDIRAINVHDIMLKRLDLAKEKGFDGVEPDNMDGYSNNSGFNFGELLG